MSQRIYACGKVTPKNDNTEKFFKFIIQGFIKKKKCLLMKIMNHSVLNYTK